VGVSCAETVDSVGGFPTLGVALQFSQPHTQRDGDKEDVCLQEFNYIITESTPPTTTTELN
jgi:hypothetical protein